MSMTTHQDSDAADTPTSSHPGGGRKARFDSPPAHDTSQARPWLTVAGWLLFGLGVVGIALPVMPTTVFWIGAVWCWSRSAPRLTRRVLSHPRFGPPVERFLTRGEMTRQGKLAAIGAIAGGYLLLQLLAQPGWLTASLVGVTLLLVALWLWARPEPLSSDTAGSSTE
jgi:uncharacterized protein